MFQLFKIIKHKLVLSVLKLTEPTPLLSGSFSGKPDAVIDKEAQAGQGACASPPFEKVGNRGKKSGEVK